MDTIILYTDIYHTEGVLLLILILVIGRKTRNSKKVENAQNLCALVQRI